MTSREDAESLSVLADALLVYSHSQVLLKRSGEELLEWFKVFLDFLRCRDEEVIVASFQPENSGSSFLLVNTPDVPFLVDSLKNILHRLPQRAMIISHPILTAQLNNGRLTQLSEQVDGDAQESFMLIQFEGVRDLDTTTIEKDIKRVFRIAQEVGRQRKSLGGKLRNISSATKKTHKKAFTEWLLNGNFICFGYAAVEISAPNGGSIKARLAEDPVGWLPQSLIPRGKGAQKARGGTQISLPLTDVAKKLFKRKKSLVVEVLEEESPLYQQDNLIYLGFRDSNKKDKKLSISLLVSSRRIVSMSWPSTSRH